jgi:short-subunit dehydrogenase
VSAHCKTAVITGASTGLGRVFARALVQAGWQVHGTSRSPDRMDQPEAGVRYWKLNLGDVGSRTQFLESILSTVGVPDLVIGNAGSGIFGAYEDLSREQEMELWEVLLHGPLHLVRGFLKGMRQRGDGTIISISSLAAEMPIPYCAVYNGAKSALSHTLQSLMMEWSGGPWLKDVRLGDFRTGFNQAMQRVQPVAVDSERWQRVWDKVEKHLQESPLPDSLESRIVRLAERTGHETVRWGSFFQAKVASCGASWFSERWLRNCIQRYYGVSN